MSYSMSQAGKVVLVTGGSRGIGRATCIAFGELGASVAVNYASNSAAAEEVVGVIRQKGGSALAVQADVSDRAQVRAMVQKIEEAFGPIDVLVNNAAVARRHHFLEMTEEDWDRVMAVNLRGVFLVTQEVVKHMAPRKRGWIINVSSIAALTGDTDVNYVTSKAGLIGFTKALAKDLARYNIRVNAVNPGMVDTEMIQDMAPVRRQLKTEQALLGRMARPEEIAAAIVFLASPASNFITASVLDVTGGSGFLPPS